MLMAARRPILAMLIAARRPIWQVHRAVLRTGEEVVVKVQRENLLDLFAIDLWNIKLAAWLADRFDPQTEATAANWKVR
jgi:predicted unusual protein kinase regulating ubiquinone biosynthesis (AarF/ABC1/UbiB family)